MPAGSQEPLGQVPGSEETDPRRAGSLGTGHEVELLIVEDNPEDLDLTLRAFRQCKLTNRIHIARDGVEALEFLFGSPPAGKPGTSAPLVILLDLKLPKVDGLEVLRRVKADARTRMVPVVVLTSSKEQRDIVETYKLGVNSFIVKPVNFERFAETVRQLGLYWLLHNEPSRRADSRV
jgi:CheY-like chemotaxis protein